MEFRVLGPVEVVAGGQPVSIGGSRERAVLARLLCSANKVVAQDALVDDLWPGEQPEGAAHALWVYVSRLRKAMREAGGGDVLVTRRPGYLLTVGPDAVDALRFEALVRSARQAAIEGQPVQAAATYAEALALWRGPAYSGISDFPFARTEVARLEEARLGALEARIEADLATGAASELIGELASLTREHPLRERLWALRMTALYRSGRQAEALLTYQELRRYLGEELGIEPSEELRQLERAVLRQELGDEQVWVATGRRGVGVEPQTKAPLPPFLTEIGRIFVGRDGELERLRQLWTEVTAGRQRVVLVGGEPGVGKTRVAAELAGRVHAEGALVLAGRCDEDLGVPYQPFVEALRHFVDHASSAELANRLGRYQGELARLLPDLGQRLPDLPSPLRSDPETERYRLFDAVAGWLVAASAAQPLLLVLDDLQWAAKPTLLLLRHVLRSAEPMRLLVLAIYRDTEVGRTHPVSELLAELRRSESVERIPLRGLAQSAVAAFLEEAAGHELGAEKEELARVIHRETEGNAFFVREVVRHLTDTGAIVQRDGRWVTRLAIDELGIPEGVREVVGRRLARLSADANRLLGIAAVVGTEFELPVVQAAAGGFDEEALLSALEEAIAARLLLELSSPVPRHRFAHALVRDTLYHGCSAARRVVLHRKAAEAIETVHEGALDNYVPALAHHWAKASAPVTDPVRAVDYARRAGDRALAQLAHDEAADYYASGLDLLDAAAADPADPRRLELLIGRGEAERRAGDPGYRQTLLDAAHLARQLGDAGALARAALANHRGFFSLVGRVDGERVAVLERALRAIGPSDSSVRARLLANLAEELGFSSQHERRERLAEEALAMARGLSELPVLAHVLARRYSALVTTRERHEEMLELAALAAQFDDAALVLWARLWVSLTALATGDVAGFHQGLDGCARLADELGQPTLRWTVGFIRAAEYEIAGKLADAEEQGRKALELGQAAGVGDAFHMYSANLFWVRYHQGRLGEVLYRYERAAARPDSDPRTLLMLALGYCELRRLDEARDFFNRVSADDFAARSRNFMWIYTLTIAAEVCSSVGDAQRAATLYDMLIPYRGLVATVGAAATGCVDHYLGLLAAVLGRFGEADAYFDSAAVMHEQLAAPTWLARTRVEWARMLLARAEPKDDERANDLLHQALATARELGLANIERGAVELLSSR